MSAETAVTDVFMADCLSARLADSYKVALIAERARGSYGAHTKNYSELGIDEVQGAGYQQGGMPLTGPKIVLQNGRVCLDFDDVRWLGADIYAIGALIYSPSRAGRAVCVLDFGGVNAAVNGATFVLPIDCPVRL